MRIINEVFLKEISWPNIHKNDYLYVFVFKSKWQKCNHCYFTIKRYESKSISIVFISKERLDWVWKITKYHMRSDGVLVTNKPFEKARYVLQFSNLNVTCIYNLQYLVPFFFLLHYIKYKFHIAF